MKRVLVTGATASIGRALVHALLRDPQVDFVLAAGREPDALAVPAEDQDRFAYEPWDLSHARAVRQLLFGAAKTHRIDTLVHAHMHRRAMEVGPKIHAIDVESTREILHLARRHPTLRTVVFRSCAQVYRMRSESPTVLDEEQALELSPWAPQWVRDRAEADLIACARFGSDSLRIVVLRFAECLAAGTGSQLYDFLQSRVGFRPIGFDPMLNFITQGDTVRALVLAIHSACRGVYNIPGGDTLPLSEVIARWGRHSIPVPEQLLGAMYRARARWFGRDFRYDVNHFTLHYSAVLAGERARDELGYVPQERIQWPGVHPSTLETAWARLSA